MSGRGYPNRRRTPSKPRWMDLRYPGKCAVCHVELAAGDRAFFDPRDRSTCCTGIECAKAHGCTRSVWVGSPTSGAWVDTLSELRLG